MPSRDVQVLRNFTQKLAGQTKQANPLAALADPKVLGMLGGGALTGLGAYGLARAMQSDEDRERGSFMPALAGLAGAVGGGYGGYHGAGYLADMLKHRAAMQETLSNARATATPQPEIMDSVDGPRDLQTHPQVTWQHQPNMGATDTSLSPESEQYLKDIEAGQPKAPATPAANKPPLSAKATRNS